MNPGQMSRVSVVPTTMAVMGTCDGTAAQHKTGRDRWPPPRAAPVSRLEDWPLVGVNNRPSSAPAVS